MTDKEMRKISESCKLIQRLEHLKNYLDIRYRKDIATCTFGNDILQLCTMIKFWKKKFNFTLKRFFNLNVPEENCKSVNSRTYQRQE